MILTEFLHELSNLAKQSGLAEPFIVGGFVRDTCFGLKPDTVTDLDITTGNSDSTALMLAASAKWPTAKYMAYDDGHVSLEFQNIRVDGSNNFIIPGIDFELNALGISDPTNIQREMFSRDFTINSLLQSLDLSKPPIDPTSMGLEDIKLKRLRTPINPDLTIGYDQRRILRALRLSLKYGLTIDDSLKKTMIKYRGGVGYLPPMYVRKQVNQMLKIDSKKAIMMLSDYKLLPIIPISKMMSMELTKNHMVQHLFD